MKTEKNFFLNKSIFPLMGFLLFSALYSCIFLILKSSILEETSDISSQQIIDLFSKYGVFAGIALGFISMIAMYVLYLFKVIFKLKKFTPINPIIFILGLTPWLIFGYELVYKEPRFTEIARGIITFAGKPMLWTSIVATSLGIIWLLISLISLFKKHD